MHIGTRLGAAGLAAALLLPTGALAAGPDQTQARQEDLDHAVRRPAGAPPDLYANTPQEVFEAKKAEIEGRLAEESDVDFAWISRVWWPSSATPTPPPISAPF